MHLSLLGAIVSARGVLKTRATQLALEDGNVDEPPREEQTFPTEAPVVARDLAATTYPVRDTKEQGQATMAQTLQELQDSCQETVKELSMRQEANFIQTEDSEEAAQRLASLCHDEETGLQACCGQAETQGSFGRDEGGAAS